MISCQCLSNVLQAEPISFLWALTDSTGAFYWTKFRLKFNFGNSTCPMERYCDYIRLHRPYPGHRAFGYCSCKQDTKERYGGQQFGQMERNICFRPVKVDYAPSNFDRSKPKRSVPLDVPTKIFGILGRLESAQWIAGNTFRISLHLISILEMAFLTFQLWRVLKCW